MHGEQVNFEHHHFTVVPLGNGLLIFFLQKTYALDEIALANIDLDISADVRLKLSF